MEKKFSIAEIVGSIIRKFRDDRHWDQTQLSILALGYGPKAEKHEKSGHPGQKLISRIETGAQEPKASEIWKFKIAFKVDIRSFFDFKLGMQCAEKYIKRNNTTKENNNLKEFKKNPKL